MIIRSKAAKEKQAESGEMQISVPGEAVRLCNQIKH